MIAGCDGTDSPDDRSPDIEIGGADAQHPPLASLHLQGFEEFLVVILGDQLFEPFCAVHRITGEGIEGTTLLEEIFGGVVRVDLL